MKKFIGLILLLNLSLIAQNRVHEKYDFKLKVGDGNRYEGGYEKEISEQKFVSGTIYKDSTSALGVGSKLNWPFLESFSEYYWKKKESTNEAIDKETYMELITKKDDFDSQSVIVNYSFYPLKVTSDSLTLYCKYILYQKKSDIAPNHFNYDISYEECFIRIRLNTYEQINIWDKVFPNCIIQAKFSPIYKVNDEEPQLSDMDESTFDPIDIYSSSNISTFAVNSELGKTDFAMGMEWFRTNKEGSKVLVKRSYAPLKMFSTIKNENDETVDLGVTVYSGLVSDVFRIYNPKKLELFNMSNNSHRKIFYSILCVPIKKMGNKYSFKLMICQGIADTRHYFMKDVDLGNNDRIKIELNPASWGIEEIVDGERLIIDSDEDYNKYVNDYIILSLESLGDLLERKPIPQNSQERLIKRSDYAPDRKPSIDRRSEKSSIIKSGSTVHIVRNGDSLSTIALRYNVNIIQLKNWNHIKGDKITIGQKLIIYKRNRK